MSIPHQLSPELDAMIQKLLADPQAEAVLYALVSKKHYAVVVAQAGKDHEIVMLDDRFDWSQVEKLSQTYRRYAGKRGVAATHTVRQLCRGVVLKHYYNWSYLTTAQKVRAESLYRQFAGYDLHERTFAAVTLQRFEVWLREHHPHLLFFTSLRQIDEDFPEEKVAVQVGDTFAMRSRAHEQSRTELLRTLAQRILTQLERSSQEVHQVVAGTLHRQALFGAPTERPEWRLSKEQRDKLEERTARTAHYLLRTVRTALASAPKQQDVLMLALTRSLDYLEKVLQDEFVLTLNAEGACTKALLRTKHAKGAYVLGSAIDPEATFRLHGDRCDLGYNIGLTATNRFIRAIVGMTGATPDSKLVAPPLAAQLQELGLAPPKLIYDRAAGSPKTFAEVSAATDGKTQLVARLIDHAKANPRFGPHDCTLGADGLLTCPAGKQTSRIYRAQGGNGWTYRFMPDQCHGCPLAAQCRSADAKPTSPRNFFISDYAFHQRQALAYLKTDAFIQDMRLRPAIERIIACLVRYHDARRATSYGVANADYQAHMAAMAFNLRTWVMLTRERRKPKRARLRNDSA